MKKIKKNRDFTIPESYGDNRVVLMVRDPWTLFCYWDLKKNVKSAVSKKAKEKEAVPKKEILRVHDKTNENNRPDKKSVLDFEIDKNSGSWYIHVDETGKKWQAEIGFVLSNGDFVPCAESNTVETPYYGMSEVQDENWKCTKKQYSKMVATSLGKDPEKAPANPEKLIEKYLDKWLSSGRIMSNRMKKEKNLGQKGKKGKKK